MNIKELKQKIKLALTENPDKKITPAELESAILDIADEVENTQAIISNNQVKSFILTITNLFDYERGEARGLIYQTELVDFSGSDITMDLQYSKEAYQIIRTRLRYIGRTPTEFQYEGRFVNSYNGLMNVRVVLKSVSQMSWEAAVRQYPAELRFQDVYLDDKQGVVPFRHPDLSTQPSILPFRFAGNYVYEQMVWLSSSDIAVGMKKVDIPTELKPESLMVIDIIGCAQSSQGCKTVDVGAAATAEGLFISVVSAISDAKGVWVKIQYCVSPNVENNYYYLRTLEEDYIRFLNSLQYGFTVQLHYKTSVSESTSAISVYGGDEFVLEGGMLDDFKNNTMYITLERKDSGAPNVVTLTDGYKKTNWYLGQPLFYSYCSIAGGLTLTRLFDNVERCLITMKKE